LTSRKSAKFATAAAVAAGALTIATGLAVAGVLPDQASDTAGDHAKVEVEETTTTMASTTTTVDDDELKTADVENESDDVETEKADVEAEGQDNRPTDTHGYTVSSWIEQNRDSYDGRDFGEQVSTQARDNAGQAQATDAGTEGKATAEEHKSAEHGESADHTADD
jgi:hypothetical protein